MKVRLPNGLTVHAMNRRETLITYRDIFEDRIYLKHGIELREGDRILDVGANIGLFALFLGQTLEDFALYAFEPIPPIFETLRRNTSRLAGKVRLFNLGLSNRGGTALFTYYPFSTFCSTYDTGWAEGLKAAIADRLAGPAAGRRRGLLRRAGAAVRSRLAHALVAFFSRSRGIPCDVETLSNVLKSNEIGPIDLLKIDVESAEWDVLQGIDEPDWGRIRQLVVEVHDLRGPARVEALARQLVGRGYEVVVDQDEASRDIGLYMVYARRAAARGRAPVPD